MFATGVGATPRRAPSGSGAGTAAGLVAVGIWGMAPVAIRALVLQLAPLPLLVIRMGVAVVVLLGIVGYNLPVTVGLQWVPASTAGLVLASEPVWLLLLAALFLGERVSRRCWAGALVALVGVASGRAGFLGCGAGVEGVAQADAVRSLGADVVVADLAELGDGP